MPCFVFLETRRFITLFLEGERGHSTVLDGRVVMALETLCRPALYLAGNKCCKINKQIKLKIRLPPAQ